jgi:hypothetical protein
MIFLLRERLRKHLALENHHSIPGSSDLQHVYIEAGRIVESVPHHLESRKLDGNRALALPTMPPLTR